MKSDLHVVPDDDLCAHDEHRACWCAPRLIQEAGLAIVVHHAADGREALEAQAQEVEGAMSREAGRLLVERVRRAS